MNNAITIGDLENRLSKGKVNFVETIREKQKVDSFDSLARNIQAGEFVVVASRPSMGKTNFLHNLLIKQDVRENEKILLLSARDKVETVLCNIDNLIQGSKTLITKNMILVNPELFKNPLDVKKFIEQAMSKYNIKGIYIDDFWVLSYFYEYDIDSEMDLIADDNDMKILFTYLGITGIQNNIPIVITEAINRDNVLRGGEMRIKHQLSDLKNDILEHIADKVIFIYRYDYYGITEDVEGNNTENVINVKIAKNKNGTSGNTLSVIMNNSILH